jgi:hypothetical protein
MIVRGHQTIGENVHKRHHILLKTSQKEEIILWLKEHSLAIIPAIVEMVVNVRHKGSLSARHGSLISQTSEFSSPSADPNRRRSATPTSFSRGEELGSLFSNIVPGMNSCYTGTNIHI